MTARPQLSSAAVRGKEAARVGVGRGPTGPLRELLGRDWLVSVF
jgi:hypothetical protein